MAGRSRSLTITALGNLLAALIRWSGLAWLVRHTFARRGVSIVLYHDPDPAELDRQLGYLSDRYSVVPMDRAVEAIRSDSVGELPPRSLVVNLDDGPARNAELTSIFQRNGVQPSIYLVTDRVGTPGTLRPDDVEQMQGTCAFESHTLTHPRLSECDDDTARREIADSRSRVESLTGERCRHFAYPAGAYTDRDARLAAEAGYLSSRTVDVGWNRNGADPHRLRILSMDPPSATMLAAELSGLKWLARLVRGEGGLDGTRRHRLRVEA